MRHRTHFFVRNAAIGLPIAMLSGCFTDSTITWTEGTWTTVEQGTAQGEDGCNLMAQLKELEPFRYNVGAASNLDNQFGETGYSDTAEPYSDSNLIDGETSPKNLLTENALEAGTQNLWNLCGDPSPNFWCASNLLLLHHDKWVETVVANHCGAEADLSQAEIRSARSYGILLNSEEMLLNHSLEIVCSETDSWGDEGHCSSQYTSRLRPQSN